jgi:hypothetical protein
MQKLYHYVGPEDIRKRTVNSPQGLSIRSIADLLSWLRETNQLSATFVIDEQETLRIADRHSEHVACAAGGPVLSAGEMFFRVEGDSVEVSEVSNQSTGFCPEPEYWPVVKSVLDRLGIAHPGRFTLAVVFRRCPGCGERNIVKDGWFVCGVCGADLPAEWNF